MSIITSVIFEPFADPSNVGGFTPLLYTINLVANVLTIGVPFTIVTIIMWNTKRTHLSMARPNADLHYIIEQYLIRYILSTIITSLYMTVICFVGFTVSGANFIYFPGVVMSALIVSFLLNGLMAFVAIAVDSPVLTFLLTSVILIYFSSTFGYSVFSADSLNSLYAPYHLFRFLAVILSGYEFANESIMVDYLRIYVESISLIGPLLVWSVFIVFSIVCSTYLLRDAMERWSHDESTWEEDEVLSEHVSIPKLDLSTRKRQKVVTLIIIGLFLSTAAFNLISVSTSVIPEDLYLYRSPENGEPIALGTWKYDTVILTSSHISQADGWVLKVTVMEWGAYSGGDGLRVRYGFLIYSLSTFSTLNDTEREDVMTSRTWGITPENPSSSTGVHHSLGEPDTYLWALRITDDSNENATYSITISIELYLHPA